MTCGYSYSSLYWIFSTSFVGGLLSSDFTTVTLYLQTRY